VADGDVFINGATSGQQIGNIGDRMKITPDGGSTSDAPGCSVTSSKLRIEFDDTVIVLPTAFVTLFNYTGSGKFFAACLAFDSTSVNIKLTIDGTEVIFNLTLDDIKDHESGKKGTTVGVFTEDTRMLTMDFNGCPLIFTTSVKIEGSKVDGGDKEMSRKMVSLTKET